MATEAPLEEVTEVAGAATVGGNYTTRCHTERWGLEETRRFYSAVQQCGTDFTLMQSLFPSRNQRQLKRKYKMEEKNHPHLVSMALQPNIAKSIDMEPFESSYGPITLDNDRPARPDVDEDHIHDADSIFDCSNDQDLIAI